MKSSKFWIAVLVAGIVVNVYDFLVHGWMLSSTYKSMPDVFNQTDNPTWFVIGDFVAVIVFGWFYDKVYGSFGGGLKGGATYGLYAGVLVSFPTWIFNYLIFAGFPYGLAWEITIANIIWGVIAGMVLGAMYKK